MTNYCKNTKSKAGPTTYSWPSNLRRDFWVRVILFARPLLTPAAQKLCRCERGVFTSRPRSFSNITSHRNRSVLLVKHSIEHTVGNIDQKHLAKLYKPH
jgi:hypothetical protein